MSDQTSKYQQSSIPSADEIRAATLSGKAGIPTKKQDSEAMSTVGDAKKKDDDSDYDWDFED